LDPSGDNFHYYLGGDYDAEKVGILERYKNYNGVDGNSPTSAQSGGEFATASKTSPDVEDINRDNTLNETETYYQYHVSLRPEDLKVGRNFISDAVVADVKFKNDVRSKVTWYQFRIPISEYESKIGSIEDFKSIRFMRMMVTGFEKYTIMRFATLQLVRGEWRQYQLDVNDGGPSITEQWLDGVLDISAVNIEENASKEPVNYLLPPGIDRVIDPNQPQLRELNEQAIVLKVKDLKDNDARMAYKNVELDLRQYQNLKMFIHAEAIPGDALKDYDLTAYIRIGSDYKDNFYEYEVPLKITEPGLYNNDSEADRKLVWPDENIVELELEQLVEVKKKRNEAMMNDPVNFSIDKIYRWYDGEKNMIKVKGNPNLSNVREIMIGIRNPGDGSSIIVNDGLPKSAEVWFNELRLTDFNNKGGWAANARVQAKLADFGSLSLAGSTSTPGFGSIEQTVDERSKEEAIQYDISSNLELGKFFSEKAAVSIPLYLGLSRSIINPQYYPGDPDILLKDALKDAETQAERDEIKQFSQDFTERKSINLTNVRWNKEVKGFRVVSPGNITAGVNYNETFSRNYTTEYNRIIRYGANLNYIYSARPKSITPFKSVKGLKSPYFRLIKDFNFNLYPSRFSFNTNLDRNYNEVKLRDVYYRDSEIKIDSTVNKDFTWARVYNLNWDFTRSLKFTYSATNIARIDEPQGGYDLFKSDNDFWKDSVRQNILNGGRNTNFNQEFNLTYNLPINKIPILDWINISARYNAKMSWDRGPILADETRDLGNNLKNSNSIQYNGQFNMNTLYNKIGFIKRIDNKYRTGGRRTTEKRYKTVNYSKRTFFKKDAPKSIFHKLGTEDVTVKVFDVDGNELKADVEIVSANKINVTTNEDYIGVTVEVEGKIELGENPVVFISENFVRALTGLKNISVSYRENGGTILMGYLPGTDFFGMNTTDFSNAPGLPFILGWQDDNFVRMAAENDWLTTDSLFNNPYIYTTSNDLSIRATFEPFRGFRIDLTGQRQYSEAVSEYYFYNDSINDFTFENRIQDGNFSISFISIGSAFEKISSDNDYDSKYFNRFKTNREVISARLHGNRVGGTHSPAYYDGYGPTSSEVLIPAFISAYGDIDPQKVTLDNFPWFMMPNWRITFDGLSRIDFIKQFVQSLNISHAYRSTYSIGSYITNLDYETDPTDGLSYIRDFQDNFVPEYQINSVSINEQISPLINVDITWKNNLITRFEIKKSRMIALSLTNNQITETRNDDLVVGTGYRFKEVPIILSTGGGQTAYKSDLNLRFDLTMRDNMTIIRPLVLEENLDKPQVSAGQKIFKINFTADYVLTERFNIQLFFDRTVNTPHTGRSYLTADTNIGFSIRFSL
ncbi:MAG: cell surface protein SprA, partial [Bacteroidales bacterium]|nr:cell surface protein SprA [Bacteroidales bacterium]